MLYLRLCLDRPGALPLREEHRAMHRAYLAAEASRILQAGPLLDENGAMTGSLMIIEAKDLADAERFHEGDPFTIAGLFETVTIRRWDRHIG